ncbi:MAG TPA: translocation/assembly module TamB domain-containing protein [Gemmatimonadaceae bacterium]|nr:translocation/assembly module TamB domain-containing protein [Gemmatimonadaceae bacterium]
MSRRRLVAIASASVMLGIVLLVVGVLVSVTQTEFGRERVRRFLVSRIAASMNGRGTMYIGRLSGGFLTGVTIDSFAIRDAEDSVFVSTGPVHVRYDIRDVLDRRLLLSHLQVDRPVVNLRRHADGTWNYRRIFPKGDKGRPGERGFGDYIMIDSAVIRGGTVVLTQPWRPADSLRGARRDSAIEAALASDSRDIRHTSEGLKRSYRWSSIDLESPFVRIADPDSAGQLVQVGRMAVVEADPPLRLKNVSGPVRILGDSVWLDLAHFELPHSAGSARGKVISASPLRFDVHITGDTVSLEDVGWVYATLPRTGGGRMNLHIRSDPRDPSIIDYRLTEMDVRSTGSHLTGAMTFGVGAPVLIVKDLDLSAEPVDFRLIETLAGEPFPVPWRGQITGTMRGRGGPLTRFHVDDARFTFRDANVSGAVTRGSGRGGLDILSPSLTVFRGFDLTLDQLDLRTIRFLYPDFPRLAGTMRGRARLDSIWTDVRFSNADITHTDGPAPPTRATGSGRLDSQGELVFFDVDMEMSPLSFTTLARSYTNIPFRGTFAGPLRAAGTTAAFDLETSLTGAAGTLSVAGHFDALPPGFIARAEGSTERLDVRRLLERPDLPATRLTGAFASDVSGDSLTALEGTVVVDLDRSSVDTLVILPSIGRFTFGNERLAVDSLVLVTDAATLTATGAFGLGPSGSDTLRYSLVVDSLGGLRPYLRMAGSRRAGTTPAPVDSEPSGGTLDSLARAISDSLSGTITLNGVLAGYIDTLRTWGEVEGRDLSIGEDRVRRLRGSYAFAGLPRDPRGSGVLELDSMVVAGVRLTSAGLSLAVPNRQEGQVNASAVSANGIRASLSFGYHEVGDTMAVQVDTMRVQMVDHSWDLARPARVTVLPSGVAVDSLRLHSEVGSAVTVRGTLPEEGPVNLSVTLDSLPLADIGAITQTRRPLDGRMSLDLGILGTRADPSMRLAARVNDASYGSVRFPYFTAQANYGDRRLDAHVQVFRNDEPALEFAGTLPVNLTLVPVERRLESDSLAGRIRADSVDLALLETMTTQLRGVTGKMSTDILIAGTWDRPTMNGQFAIFDGEAEIPELGIRLQHLGADIAFTRDSLIIRRFSAMSGERRTDTLSLTGAITFKDRGGPPPQSPAEAILRRMELVDLSLAMNQFQAIRSRRIADATLSGDLHLFGPYREAHLDGAITVDRGVLYLPDQPEKQLIDVSDPEFATLVDTTQVSGRGLLPERRNVFVDTLFDGITVENVEVRLGEEVWLRSEQANVRLGGAMGVTRAGDQLALTGELEANRGTYRLDLGVALRTFQVDSGSIRFFGEPQINPELDIWASYSVRQANRQDVRVRAHIQGTLLQPRLALSSDERIQISQAEIISYLVFGAPTFVVGEQSTAAVQAFLPTVGGILERALSEQLQFFDLFQISAGAWGDQGAVLSRGGSALAGSRIGVGKQLGENTFLTANAGLCNLGSGGGGSSFASTLGLSLEHRLSPEYSLQLSVEPSTIALFCRPGVANIDTPRQFGFDLFREWSF